MNPLVTRPSLTPESTYQTESFDGGLSLRCRIQRPDRYAFFHPSRDAKYMIARGAGLSYAAASFGVDFLTVDMSSFDRILAFDEQTGVVQVEAGVRMGDLFRFLASRRQYLKVQPGHGLISVGGCIAADVHGKNQARDGTFFEQVESLQLFHPNHGLVDLSPGHNADLFRATCGGYGTTGIIVTARLRSTPTPGNMIEVQRLPVAGVTDAAQKMRLLARENEFVYSWHDFAAASHCFGRGFVVAGRFVGAPASCWTRHAPNIPELSSSWRNHFHVALMNRWSCKLINAIHHRHLSRNAVLQVDPERGMFPIHGSETYFRAFGKNGFHEYQAIVPHDRLDEYISGIRVAMKKHRVSIALASAKVFAGEAELARFSGEGICFAINVPRGSASSAFIEDLDRLVVGTDARPNAIKDSRLPRAVYEAAYPKLPQLRRILREWDPARLFRSELSQRLGL